MKAYVIRHGETQANAKGVLEGRTDGHLTEAGEMLAREVGRALAGIRFDMAYTSPLSRALKTAEAVLAESGNDNTSLIEDDRLLEVDMGEWEGLRFLPGDREVDAELCRQFFEEPFKFGSFPKGESIAELCARTQGFLRWLVESACDATVLVSTHGCALRAMLNKLYVNPFDFWQGGVPLNCTVSIVEGRGGDLSLIERDLVLYDSSLCVDRYARY